MTFKSHGGPRKGAGRKAGSITKQTAIKRKAIKEAVEAARAEGETPLEYMLRVMRDVTADEKRRDSMAVAASSFIHPRLAAVEHSGNEDKPVSFMIMSSVPRPDDDAEDTA